MCGLLGFIGVSKNPEITKKLITSIFVKTQSRGIDASGFYCVSDFLHKEVYFYKEPTPSSEFVKKEQYAKLWNYDLSLGLFHCRAATSGVGLPSININNHPFISRDYQKAVIHNGFINKNELKEIKSVYETETDCDSEVILRIMEQDGTFDEIMKNILAWTEKSAYAVAYAQSNEDSRHLCLFRNHQRPLWLIDLTEDLGQYMFCSTAEIFLNSIDDLPEFQNLKFKIHEINPYFIVNISCDVENNFGFYCCTAEQSKFAWDKMFDYKVIQDKKTKLFKAPISFDASIINSDKTTEIDTSLEKLEDALFSYIKRKKAGKIIEKTDFSRIVEYSNLLQDLLQKDKK